MEQVPEHFPQTARFAALPMTLLFVCESRTSSVLNQQVISYANVLPHCVKSCFLLLVSATREGQPEESVSSCLEGLGLFVSCSTAQNTKDDARLKLRRL